MSEFESRVAASLERLVPPKDESGQDWLDVVRRADRHGRTLTRVALAAAGCAAVVLLGLTTPIGAAIANGAADFSAWLTGHPGKQAEPSEQRAFEATNGRSWAAFPRGTQLRELIRTNVSGQAYVLSGFRSGKTLCLQLDGMTRRTKTAPACAPLSTLAHTSAPVLVIDGNGEFVDQYSHVSAKYSFGIAADGVKRVDVHALDGTHRALIGGNAYLWIEPDPNTGEFVKSVAVTVAGGATTALPIQVIRLGSGFAVGAPRGPTHVQARIDHPTIRWVDNHERRGLLPQNARLAPQQREQLVRCCADARFFKPDPFSNLLVGIQAPGPDQWCIVTSDGGGSCGDKASFFSHAPFNFMTFGGGSNASDQFMGIAGVAADGVERIRIFLADGERQSAPVSNNVFGALIPARYPIRVVAYDAKERIVGIQTFPSAGMHGLFGPSPAARGTFHRVLRVQGPLGSTATVSVGPVRQRQRCWRIVYSTGQSETGCDLTFYTGPKIIVNLVQQAGRDLYILGGADSRITARVELHFDNGDVLSTRPIEDRFVFAIPKAHLDSERHFAYVLAVDHHGHHIQRQGIAFRTTSG